MIFPFFFHKFPNFTPPPPQAVQQAESSLREAEITMAADVERWSRDLSELQNAEARAVARIRDLEMEVKGGGY